MVEYVSLNFVPVAGAVEQLQPSRYGNSQTYTSKWFAQTARAAFRRWAPKGWWKEFKTYQGVYVIDPAGTPFLYRVIWKQKPEEILRDLKSARKSYIGQKHKKVIITQSQIKDADLKKPPQSGISVVQVFSRLSPLPESASDSERAVGRDNMWILRSEVQNIISTVNPIGNWKKMQESLVARMVRFHLLNNSGNVGYMFGAEEVRQADFKIKLDKVGKAKRYYSFVGRFDSAGRSNDWGKSTKIKGGLEGRVTIDTEKGKIVGFKAYGSGIAKGGNDSVSKSHIYPIKFAFREVVDKKTQSIPPFAYGLSPVFHSVYLHPKISKR